MTRRSMRTILISWIVIALLLAACTAGPAAESDEREVGIGGARAVRAEIIMGAGQLSITSGVAQLARMRFHYDSPAWKPDLSYTVERAEGALTLRQPRTSSADWGQTGQRNNWEIAFNESIPLDLAVTLGAGESDLDVGRLNLTRLEVTTGAGKMQLNLVGARQRDLYVSVKGGVGELSVDLPADVGVVVDVQAGLGSVEVQGLVRKGLAYVNEAYGQSSVTLHLSVQGGVGAIRLRVMETTDSAQI